MKWSTSVGTDIFKINCGFVSAYLVKFNELNILVDTGHPSSSLKINNILKKFEVDKIDYLILTHTHFDHAANANHLREIFSASLVVNSSEVTYISNGVNPKTNPTNFFASVLISSMNLFEKKGPIYQQALPDIEFDEVLHIKDKGINLKLLKTAGHTIGSSSIILDDEIAIVGDTMFGILPNSIYPFFVDNKVSLLDSWGKLLATDCKLFLPAHGNAIKREKLEKNLLRFSR